MKMVCKRGHFHTSPGVKPLHTSHLNRQCNYRLQWVVDFQDQNPSTTIFFGSMGKIEIEAVQSFYSTNKPQDSFLRF